MTDTPTFGRYAEIPVDKMTAEQKEGYQTMMGARGSVMILAWRDTRPAGFTRACRRGCIGTLLQFRRTSGGGRFQ